MDTDREEAHQEGQIQSEYCCGVSSAGLASPLTWWVKGQGIILVPYCSRPKPASFPG
jgi:hypothetical protein